MATTLAQQHARAQSDTFKALVSSAFWALVQDISKETVGTIVKDGAADVTLNQAMLDKRNAWVRDFIRQPGNYWIDRCALLLAAEPAIIAEDVVTEATVIVRAHRLVHTLAGVRASDAP